MHKALAATRAKAPLEPFEYDPGPLPHDEIEIKVHSCGICHSDLSMLDNDWQNTKYPFVPGHEAIGTVHAVGEHVKNLTPGQTVGLGWYSRSDNVCRQCLSGDHNLCPNAEQTIVGRFGAFADFVRCHHTWAVPIPPGVDPSKAGPLLCAGITVFNPIVQFGVRPTHRAGVIGIGGLGHLAIAFLNAWGCDVTAFSSSADKEAEARSLGAHRFVNSRDSSKFSAIAGSLDFIISTVNVNLKWSDYIGALAPRGRLHFVGVVPDPVPATVFSLLGAQRSISGTPAGSPATIATMLDFCARHKIAPITEDFPFARANDAMEHLRAGKPRYRIVLQMPR